MGNWDKHIDEVARQMTEGRPGASFNAQVLARIETGATRSGVRRAVWMWSPVAVAVTALVLALAIAGPR